MAKVLYPAEAHVAGGRQHGHGRGNIDVVLTANGKPVSCRGASVMP